MIDWWYYTLNKCLLIVIIIKWDKENCDRNNSKLTLPLINFFMELEVNSDYPFDNKSSIISLLERDLCLKSPYKIFLLR